MMPKAPIKNADGDSEESSNDDDDDVPGCFRLQVNSVKAPLPLCVQLKLNRRAMEMEVDTGVAV